LCSECKGDSEKKIRARTEGCQPDVLGDDLFGAVTQVDVNEICEAGHHSQHRQKTKNTRKLSRQEQLSAVSQWMVRSREAQRLFIERSWLRWGRQRETEAGQGRAGRVSFSFRDKM